MEEVVGDPGLGGRKRLLVVLVVARAARIAAGSGDRRDAEDRDHEQRAHRDDRFGGSGVRLRELLSFASPPRDGFALVTVALA